MRLIDFFDKGASFRLERTCLIDLDGRSLTYGETQRLTHRIGNKMSAAGVGAQRAAAVLSPNDMYAFVCILGILRSGAAWMPVNARNAMVENISNMADNDCEFLFYHSSFEHEVEAIRAGVPSLKGIVCIDAPGNVDPDLVSWLEDSSDEECFVPAGPSDIACFWPSGGTTGKSKGILLTHLNFETMISNFASSISYRSATPVHLMAAPMTHAAGCVAFPTLAVGGTQVISPNADALTIMQAIEKYKVTTLFLPPTVIYNMLGHPRVREFDYSSLRNMIYAAAPMSSSKLAEAIEIFGPVMTQTFGQAESPMICTFMSPEEHLVQDIPGRRSRLTSCGRPTMFTQLAIMDDDGNLLGDGEVGEIVVRGNLVMKGYYKNPAATEEASRFGWHHTGDIGMRDEDGYYYILDRKRDMIISGGFNIYPSEIEQVLWGHPAVEDCAVIGVPDDKWGEAVKAVIQLKPGAEASTQEFEHLCRARLGGMKTPKSFEIWDALPRSPVGKVLKRTIRDHFWAGRERKV